jgi:hypothetical protein
VCLNLGVFFVDLLIINLQISKDGSESVRRREA